MAPNRGRAAPLPYKLLAGIAPCRRGWLVATGKLQGTTLYPQVPEIFPKFIDVLDYVPAFEVIALDAPVGLLDDFEPGGRACEREARRLLKWPRSGAIASAPIRAALDASSYD